MADNSHLFSQLFYQKYIEIVKTFIFARFGWNSYFGLMGHSLKKYKYYFDETSDLYKWNYLFIRLSMPINLNN